MLIGAAGAGLIGAAVFATDPVSRYPPGTLDALPEPSRTGIAHNLAAIPVFFGLPAAALACSGRARRTGQRGFALYSAGTAITMLATMALAAAGFGQSPRLVNLGGLFQRASIITGFAWLTALCARARPCTGVHSEWAGLARFSRWPSGCGSSLFLVSPVQDEQWPHGGCEAGQLCAQSSTVHDHQGASAA